MTILSHTVYIMYTHTYGSIHISVHTYTHTYNDRKDWNNALCINVLGTQDIL